MRKINEIFYSLQGEGAHAGVASIFIRFSGCNLACPFCDTDHFDGQDMEDEEIFRKVISYPADWVILTGGEPTLQIDSDFIARLKKSTGKKIAIETNGTHPCPEGLDWITVSPKTGISGFSSVGEKSADVAKDKVIIPYADEIKVVDVGQDLEQYFSLPCRSETTMMFLQPCFVAEEKQRISNRKRTVERVMKDPRWRLSVQLHRYLDIP